MKKKTKKVKNKKKKLKKTYPNLIAQKKSKKRPISIKKRSKKI